MRSRGLLILLAMLLACGVATSSAAELSEGRILMTLAPENLVAAVTPGGEVLASAPVGVRPHGLAVHEGELFVANRGPGRAAGSSLTVLDLETLRPERTIYACEHCAPTEILFDEEGRLWFTAQADRAIYSMEPPFEHPSGSIILAWGWPTEIMQLPGEPRLVIGMRAANEFAIVSTQSRTFERRLLGPAPSQLARKESDEAVWILADTIGRIGRLAAFGDDDEPAWEEYPGAAALADAAFEGGGDRLLTTSLKKNRLVLLDPASAELLSVVEFDEPVGVISPDPRGGRFAVSLPTSERVAIFRISDGDQIELERKIEVPGTVGRMLWVAN